MAKKLSEKVSAYIEEQCLFAKGDSVLCALSGGADSVALLLLLKDFEQRLEIKLFAAHLNHCIRGEEADRDERFCAELCQSLGVPFVSEKIDVPQVAAERKNGLEEAARAVRYEFLRRACDNLGCNKIATAHHADDNIETVLLHMLRGCGLGGLKGISPIMGEIVRPLLSVRKQEIEAFLAERCYTFVHDSTNDELDCTRNYIRHKILPCIYELNGSADSVFLRMCTSLAKDGEYLDMQAAAVPENATRAQLATLHDAVLSRYIRMRYAAKTGKTALEGKSVELIIKAVKNGEAVQYNVQGDVTVFVSASGVDFVSDFQNIKINEAFALSWGENIISPIGYKILITKDKNVVRSFTNIYKSSISVQVKGDKITKDGALSVLVRTRRAGDAYTFGKMRRDVRRQLINFKIPIQSRDMLPVFCVEDEIFYVHGLRLADGYEASGEDGTVYIAVSKV